MACQGAGHDDRGVLADAAKRDRHADAGARPSPRQRARFPLARHHRVHVTEQGLPTLLEVLELRVVEDRPDRLRLEPGSQLVHAQSPHTPHERAIESLDETEARVDGDRRSRS
jgi:hypothetical protein